MCRLNQRRHFEGREKKVGQEIREEGIRSWERTQPFSEETYPSPSQGKSP